MEIGECLLAPGKAPGHQNLPYIDKCANCVAVSSIMFILWMWTLVTLIRTGLGCNYDKPMWDWQPLSSFRQLCHRVAPSQFSVNMALYIFNLFLQRIEWTIPACSNKLRYALQGQIVPKRFERVLPAAIFGSLVIIGGLLSILLPETTGHELPETVEEANAFPQ